MNLRRHGTSLVLLLIAVALGVYAFAVDRGSVTKAERTMRERNVFPAYRREELSRVELARDGETMVLERPADATLAERPWRLSAPMRERADAAMVDRLLGALEFASVVRRVDPGVARLEPARVRGAIQMGKLAYRFVLGADAPTPEGAAYLRVEGEGVYVVSRDLVAELLKPADTYRERAIVPYSSLELAALELHGPTGAFALERADVTTFRLADSRLRASRDRLERVWSALAELRAEAFLSEADAACGPTSPAFVVKLKPRDAEKPPGEIAVGGVCPGHPEDVIVVRRAPTPLCACAPRGVLEGLGAQPGALVDTRLFGARDDEIEGLTLQALPSGTTLDLARTASGFRQRSPEQRDLEGEEADAAAALVSAVARAEGTGVRKEPLVGFVPRVRIRVVKAAGEGDEVVEIGAVQGAEAPVHRLADDAWLHIDARLFERLTPRATVLRGGRIWAPGTESRTPVALSARCRGVTQELARDARGWTMRTPSGFSADAASASEVASALVRAKAEYWVADADDGRFGFRAEDCSLRMTTRGEAGSSELALVFGAETEGGVYAHVASEPAVFVVSRALRDLAARIFVDRGAVQIPTAQLASLTLTRGAKRLVLTRRGEQLVDLDAGGRPGLALGRLGLDQLRADEVVHLGPPGADEGFGAPRLDVRALFGGDAGQREVRLRIGRAALVRGETMLYARVDGVNATFAVARERIEPLVNLP